MATKHAQICQAIEAIAERDQVFTRLIHANDRLVSKVVAGSVMIIWMTLRTRG